MSVHGVDQQVEVAGPDEDVGVHAAPWNDLGGAVAGLGVLHKLSLEKAPIKGGALDVQNIHPRILRDCLKGRVRQGDGRVHRHRAAPLRHGARICRCPGGAAEQLAEQLIEELLTRGLLEMVER
jgi:hypothetical protein